MRNLLLFSLCLILCGHSLQAQESDRTLLTDTLTVSDSLVVSKGAHLVLSCRDYDFGEVERRGGDLRYTLQFRNEGSSPLVLTRVITSCTCLKGDFSKRPIPPGGEGKLVLTYEPLKAAPGAFNKVVQILSNSSSGRELFTIRGKSVEKKRKHDEK